MAGVPRFPSHTIDSNHIIGSDNTDVGSGCSDKEKERAKVPNLMRSICLVRENYVESHRPAG